MASNMLEWADAPEGETKLTFVEKERRVKDIMKDSIANAENPVVCFSGGKKSLVLLHLLKNLPLCGALPHDPASPVKA